ncbi:hypothetical protein [Pedosphaera parvula]|uniref:Uncharacterized protein n=1 Tax=Pedosphaera parvula (strain Ellin514) TaxID=320771 RepID=B9XJI5_PEDPL|nr:hypothetical protein [Pedosphaera parvula]EEF60046.1 hypothetical protein Cflav_PD3105 [Pedosphaera parvula Ellin514]
MIDYPDGSEVRVSDPVALARRTHTGTILHLIPFHVLHHENAANGLLLLHGAAQTSIPDAICDLASGRALTHN